MEKNPFNPTQEISVTNLLTLESINEKLKTCVINQELEFDLSEFIEVMKGMIRDANDLEVDIEISTVITFDYESTWVTKIMNSSIITVTNPRGIETKKEQLTTSTIE